MNVITTHLHLGATAPFAFLHATDTHMTFADERDDERKMRIAKWRWDWISEQESEEVLEELVRLSKEKGLPIFHTGDLLDFISVKNFEKAREFLSQVDLFMATGNHEFCRYMCEDHEDLNYKLESLPAVQSLFQNDIRFSSRVVNGINFLAIDNSYHQFEQWQLDRLKEEAAKGMPMVMLMHAPIYGEEHYNFLREDFARCGQPDSSMFMMAVPEEKMQYYAPGDYASQKADETTYAAYDYILHEPMIKAVIAGHLHRDFDAMIHPGLRQIMTGTRTVREFIVD